MIEELKWDSKIFGRKMGRLSGVPSERSLRNISDKARRDNYQHLTCRFNVNRVSKIQMLEKYGFYIADLGVVWERKTGVVPSPVISVRKADIRDVAMLRKMSKGLFTDSRFYNDPFFTRNEADMLYQVWIENSVHDSDIATFVVDKKGFITCKKLSRNKGDIPLIGVIARERGKGVGSSLMETALSWFKATGVRTVTVRTQANNVGAMNFYKGLGFSVKYVDTTMGKILTAENTE